MHVNTRYTEDVPLVEFVYFVFTHMPGESYRRRHRSLVLCLRCIFRALINSLVCWLLRWRDRDSNTWMDRQRLWHSDRLRLRHSDRQTDTATLGQTETATFEVYSSLVQSWIGRYNNNSNRSLVYDSPSCKSPGVSSDSVVVVDLKDQDLTLSQPHITSTDTTPSTAPNIAKKHLWSYTTLHYITLLPTRKIPGAGLANVKVDDEESHQLPQSIHPLDGKHDDHTYQNLHTKWPHISTPGHSNHTHQLHIIINTCT